jgi:hypothetical protein
MHGSRLDELALLSVSRACGFAGLAIFCFMIGLAGYPVIALNSGAVLMMLSAAVLAIKAEMSPTRPYKRTELWVILQPYERPSDRFAQQVIGNTLRGIYLRFAVHFARGGLFCFALALALQLSDGLVAG